MKFNRIFAIGLVMLCGATIYAALQHAAAPSTPLAGFAPPGALLAIESPDFAGLLSTWNNSPEQRRWLAGENYDAFSRSRLFGRLGDAQDQFAATAGLAPDSKFLQQIAGGQSLLAWYDIGNLELLYITHLPHGAAANTPLLKLRDKFEQRSVGADTFFVRSQTDPARTVAFAVRGDYLLLATREDLLADALLRMQQPTERSLLHDSWYATSIAAAPEKPGDLRMTLNLASIVPSPYFRSYWIQRNITDLKQYRAAVSDLYRSSGNFREERVLIPVADSAAPAGVNLSTVLGYVPPDAGFYRAGAQPTSQQVIEQLEDKVLARGASAAEDAHVAPVADLETPVAGDASDLEERIDEPLIASPLHAQEIMPLRDLVGTVQPAAMMVFSSAAGEGSFKSIHSAVVLESAADWDEAALQKALGGVLAGRLTVGAVGWSMHHAADGSSYILDGADPVAFAVRGKICVVATDEATLLRLLAAGHNARSEPRIARVIAGVDFASEREPFTQLTTLLDQTAAAPTDSSQAPAFFSGNVGSVATSFGDLRSETFTESATDAHLIRQTVLYQWGKN